MYIPPYRKLQFHPDLYAAPASRFRKSVDVFKKGACEGSRSSDSLSHCLLRQTDPIIYFPRDGGMLPDGLYTVEPPTTLLPNKFLEITPRATENAKNVPLWGISMLHNTGRLNEIDPCRRMGDNPMLALSRLYARAFSFMDGERSLGQIFNMLCMEYGSFVRPDHFLSFVCELVELGFLRDFGANSLQFARVQDREWDLNISTVQHQFAYTELPLYTLLELTYACNLGCRTCYTKAFADRSSPEDTAFLETILDPIIASGVSYVTLLGGEPLVKRGLTLEVVRRLRESHIYTKLITNGTLLDERTAHALDEAGLNKVELSLDGCERATNDRNRGQGTFDRVVSAIDVLGTTAIPQVGLSITVHGENHAEIINGLPVFLAAHPVSKVYFSRYFSRSSTDETREMSPEQERVLAEKCVEWQGVIGAQVPHFEAVILGHECTCGRSSVVVNPRGKMKACPFITLEDDSLQIRSFREIWENSPAFWQIRGLPPHSCATRNLRNTGQINPGKE